jgi:predicted nucleic acid-binding protein
MTPQVLDASVAIKWFVEGETGRADAIDLLDRIRDDPSTFVVPELFFNEMLAVLARLVGSDGATLRGHLEALQDLGMERVGNGRELIARASGIASRYRLSGYDSIYAACADLTGGCWLTADLRAHRRIQHLRISRVVCQG